MFIQEKIPIVREIIVKGLLSDKNSLVVQLFIAVVVNNENLVWFYI
jgi:hypothetical protein